MKKAFCLIVIAAIIVAAFGFNESIEPSPFVGTYVKSGYTVTSSGTSEVDLQFDDLPLSQLNGTLVYILVDPNNSGTIQFSTGDPITASNYAYAAGSRVPITIKNGYDNLHYKASTSGQTFAVTY